MKNNLLTFTEGGMILYWIFASLVVVDLINIPPEYMYSDYKNPLIISWNWSFLPLDILFALLGLISRFGNFTLRHKKILSIISLSLMFCAGLMAISFWVINHDFDPFWWGINLWLLVLSTWGLVDEFCAKVSHLYH